MYLTEPFAWGNNEHPVPREPARYSPEISASQTKYQIKSPPSQWENGIVLDIISFV